jgi:NADH:ubiquinone oxidoreductase subunit 2 (subunit N)
MGMARSQVIGVLVSHHAILVLLAVVTSALAIAIGLRALLALARSGRHKANPVPQGKRLSLWVQVLNCPILILIVLPQAVTQDWWWRIGCLLVCVILWLIMGLLLLRMRFVGSSS